MGHARPRPAPADGLPRRAVQRIKQQLLRWLERCLRSRRRRAPAATRPTTAKPRHRAVAELPAPTQQLMHRQLASLLDRHPRARAALHQLALLERVLRQRGAPELWTLPDPVLGRALWQLEALTDDWSQAGLAELRSRLAVAVRRHERSQAESARGEMLSTFGTPDKVQVTEVGLSMFEEFDQSWAKSRAASTPKPRP